MNAICPLRGNRDQFQSASRWLRLAVYRAEVSVKKGRRSDGDLERFILCDFARDCAVHRQNVRMTNEQ